MPAAKLFTRNAAAYVARKLSGLPPSYRAVATLYAPVEEVARRLGRAAGQLEPIDERSCRLHSRADSLEWPTLRLAALGCEFEVHEPPQLAEYLGALGTRLTRAAGGTAGS
ncbi:WYL domain-containing protein [Streptantibioticus ferralitis]|uniref:WCX domain-containing protein n=1 Tax=Streptantibioticus ferralitis TaxID=236510 RepID=A0ABT5YX43_9ACTN|nr:WYL domain-containing protein [Streptantibioticus ferralitis]MDF2256124.1 hypothetical protein [Streptantibioticus ferralitis]